MFDHNNDNDPDNNADNSSIIIITSSRIIIIIIRFNDYVFVVWSVVSVMFSGTAFSDFPRGLDGVQAPPHNYSY